MLLKHLSSTSLVLQPASDTTLNRGSVTPTIKKKKVLMFSQFASGDADKLYLWVGVVLQSSPRIPRLFVVMGKA